MRILFDHNVPYPLRSALPDHHVETAFERGWSTLINGDLISAAETAEFDVLITADRGFQYQQNWSNRNLRLLILSTNDWTRIRRVCDRVADAVAALSPGQYAEFDVPYVDS